MRYGITFMLTMLTLSATSIALAGSTPDNTYTWTGYTTNWSTPGGWLYTGNLQTSAVPVIAASGSTLTDTTYRLRVGSTSGSSSGNNTLVYNGGYTIVDVTNFSANGYALVVGASANASMSIQGGTLECRNSVFDVIGSGVSGTLSIDGGNYVNTAAHGTGIIQVGRSSGGTGYLNVNSGSAAITRVQFYESGVTTTIGYVNLNGGTLSAGSFTDSSSYATSTFNFNGGTLAALGNSTAFMTGLDNVYVKTGGAIIDTAGYSVTIGNGLLQYGSTIGGLTKNGAGVLTLSGANTYTGATTINAGTLSVTGSLATSGVYIASAGSTSSSFSNQATFSKSLAASANFSVATAINSDFGTSGTLSGTNGSTAGSLAASWRTRDASELNTLISDVLNVAGAASGTSCTLTMSYDTATLAARGIGESLDNIYIAYLNGTDWTAVVGTYSLDATDHTISVTVASSSVISNTGLQFAVVPEPNALALLVGAAMGLIAYAWKKRKN